MQGARKFNSFAEFYPYYLMEHSRRGTRIVHFTALAVGLGLGIVALVRQDWVFVAAALLVGYGGSWTGHLIFEKNRPAFFHNPIYSTMSDFRMFFDLLTGRQSF